MVEPRNLADERFACTLDADRQLLLAQTQFGSGTRQQLLQPFGAGNEAPTMLTKGFVGLRCGGSGSGLVGRWHDAARPHAGLGVRECRDRIHLLLQLAFALA